MPDGFADPFGSFKITDPNPYGGYTPDGIVRQKVRCRVTVFSHVLQSDTPELNGEYELYDDVISCEVSKSLKGGGGANFILVPRRNYMNLIYPNDYVNICFDPGDGRGWIRTFFGLVDRVNRMISTDQTGATTTRFQVVCSDLTKAFDHIQVYFNPQLLNPKDPNAFRPDIASEFTQNLGGVSMMMAGITIHGTPADILMSLCQLFLGFGAQFTLPYSLSIRAGQIIQKNRQARLAWARERLPEVVKDAMEATGAKSIAHLEEILNHEATQLATQRNGGTTPTAREVEAALSDVLRGKEMRNASWQTQKELMRALYLEQSTLLAKQIEAKAALPQASLLDLIDFRHVEWRAIDGTVMSASISQQEGTLWSLMNAWSYEFLNELFVDLRPMQDEPTPAASGSGYKQDLEVCDGGYERRSDSLNSNVREGDEDPPGVRYEPCLVMREHPFSTIQDFDPPVGILEQFTGGVAKLQKMVFGAIFSKEPGITGRKTVLIETQNPYLMDKKPPEMAIRSLDAITINVRDIMQENVGRSDSDHVNFIEVYTDVTGGGQIQNIQLLTRIVIPVTCSVNVSRHGLRLRRLTSKFARFSKNPGVANSFFYFPTINATIRWALLLDHWYQHNQEYLTGTFTLRGMPELRVGYRLDVAERNESYYVENVSHRWAFTTQALMTTVQVSRGQRNDPFPVYVYPSSPGFSGYRSGPSSRLAQYFHQKNPSAVSSSQYTMQASRELAFQPDAESGNLVDTPDPKLDERHFWAEDKNGFEVAGSSTTLKDLAANVIPRLSDELAAMPKTLNESLANQAVQGMGPMGILKLTP